MKWMAYLDTSSNVDNVSTDSEVHIRISHACTLNHPAEPVIQPTNRWETHVAPPLTTTLWLVKLQITHTHQVSSALLWSGAIQTK